MKFAFTDEQRMLKDTSQSFLAAKSDSMAVRAACRSPQHFEVALWRSICNDMYWQGVLVPEVHEGLALGWVEMAIIMEAAGERLLTSPLFAVTQSTALLNVCMQSALRDRCLADIAKGHIVSLALTNAVGNWHASGVCVSDSADGLTLSGEARFVPFGFAASTLLVVATNEDQSTSIWVVQSDAIGVSVQHTPTLDQTRPMSEVRLESVAVGEAQRLSSDAGPLIEQVVALSRILIVADQVGVAQASLDLSVDYTKERLQFNRSIASFQAIKHKAADMMVKVESARSLLYFAACIADAWCAQEATDAALQEAAYMASACASDAAFFNAGSGIQMHGGVGITEEYDIQLYFKRARSTESYLGRPPEMREAIACQLLDGGDAWS
ncbi:acyl-CoA dehydrogenase family protein [Luminiphilus sp.]|nr:acyl-CoA dehydrogenase family protein [Luminiphilus sp.]